MCNLFCADVTCMDCNIWLFDRLTGAAVYNGKLYVVGGCSGSAGLKNGVVYDPKTNKWENIARMQQGRSYTFDFVFFQ